MGANLPVLADWSTEYTFVDAFKQSRPWLPQAEGVWDTLEFALLDLDENGWPRSLPASNDTSVQYRWVTALMFNGIEGHYPPGEYIVLYDGTGTLAYGLDATKNEAESSNGRDVIDVAPGRTTAGFSLSITSTDPFNTGDYIRNVRVLMPGFDETNYQSQTFHPTFLANVKNYKVLRFMDWMRTNWDSEGPIRDASVPEATWSHPLHDAEQNPYLRRGETAEATRSAEMLPWSNRPKPTDSTFASENGVPVEVMVELANTLGADPWFNMPHLASDEYMANFASTVARLLTTERRVYVEYSNEVWNTGFGQALWVEQQGINTWPTSTKSDLEKRLNWFGQRSAEMCQIWKASFGPNSEQVICVMATQAANSWIGEQTLDCPLSQLKPCHIHVDALAIAPYFGQHIGNPINETTLNQWITEADGGLSKLFTELAHGSELELEGLWISKTSLKEAKTYIDSYINVANARDLDLIAYEGGQHLVGIGAVTWNDGITKLFGDANRDSRMSDLYTEYHDYWNAAGGQMFVVFNSSGTYSQWGNWGTREYADSVNSAKQSAVDNFIAANGCDWATCNAPESLEPTAIALSTMQSSTGGSPSPVTLSIFILLLLSTISTISPVWRISRR